MDKRNGSLDLGVASTPERPAYLGRATTNIEAGSRFGYSFDRNQRMFLDVGGTHWGAGITDSPIVGKKNSPAVRVGYLYRF